MEIPVEETGFVWDFFNGLIWTSWTGEERLVGGERIYCKRRMWFVSFLIPSMTMPTQWHPNFIFFCPFTYSQKPTHTSTLLRNTQKRLHLHYSSVFTIYSLIPFFPVYSLFTNFSLTVWYCIEGSVFLLSCFHSSFSLLSFHLIFLGLYISYLLQITSFPPIITRYQ